MFLRCLNINQWIFTSRPIDHTFALFTWFFTQLSGQMVVDIDAGAPTTLKVIPEIGGRMYGTCSLRRLCVCVLCVCVFKLLDCSCFGVCKCRTHHL
jgi:hypothetical protein